MCLVITMGSHNIHAFLHDIFHRGFPTFLRTFNLSEPCRLILLYCIIRPILNCLFSLRSYPVEKDLVSQKSCFFGLSFTIKLCCKRGITVNITRCDSLTDEIRSPTPPLVLVKSIIANCSQAISCL